MCLVAPCLHGNIYLDSYCIAAECWSHMVCLYCLMRISVSISAAESADLKANIGFEESTNSVSLRLDSSRRQIKVLNPVL